MALVSLPSSPYRELRFQAEAWANPVRLGEIFGGAEGTFLALPGRVAEAVLYETGGWFHGLYNRRETLLELIDHLPAEPEPKFVALPELAWARVRERWPELHFNDHEIFRYRPAGAPPRPLPEPAPEAEMSALAAKDVPVLLRHQLYLDEYGGEPYLRARIEAGRSLGVRLDGQLVGWEIVQSDGTLGFLRVLPPYRRRGLATLLHRRLSLSMSEQGLASICHISHDNPASLALAARLGMESLGRVSWVRRRTREEIREYEEGRF
jgi:ribosomal protein S18 acetylase RimI-like enzyme